MSTNNSLDTKMRDQLEWEGCMNKILLTSKTSQTPSIGLIRVLLLQLRTKVLADLAGPSPPLDRWKEETKSRMETLFLFPSNNLLIAQRLRATWDAMEV